MSLKEVGKKAAAYSAIDKYVKVIFMSIVSLILINVAKNGQKIGIGSGSTIAYGVERLAEKVTNEHLNVFCAASSFQARQLILEHKLPLISLEEHTELDIAFDGADEIDNNLFLIKGGGGCHLQEKLIASATSKLIIIADDSKDSINFGDKWQKGVPVEVIPMSYAIVKHKIEKQYGGDAVLRPAIGKMGPLVTDNGNFVLDWKFETGPGSRTYNWREVDRELHMIPGVLETGFFIDMALEAFFGRSDGSVYSRKSENI